jgi:chromate transporter
VGDRGRLREAVGYFFRLGVIAFGGPAAHIALMRRELVQQRGWVTDEEFIDLLGVTNLVPGPNSTEMTMYLGGRRAGLWGLWLGGAAFIAPAVAIVLALSWAYVRWGTTPAGEALIYGIEPFVLAIITQAIWGLRRAAVKSVATFVVGVAAVAAVVLGVSEVVVILGGGVALLVWMRRRWLWGQLRRSGGAANAVFLAAPGSVPGWKLFLVFLKMGAVLYGSGYVLVAFMQGDLVDSRHWLTHQQLVDAIAVGQFTPGPVFSSATFAGYVAGGWPGALGATAGIFLPSFLLVTLTYRLVPRLRSSAWAGPFLDGVNVAALVLMAVVTAQLARDTLTDAFTIGLFAVAAAILVRWNPNSMWLIGAGVVAGLAHAAL